MGHQQVIGSGNVLNINSVFVRPKREGLGDRKGRFGRKGWMEIQRQGFGIQDGMEARYDIQLEQTGGNVN